jgi:hypothetical protein
METIRNIVAIIAPLIALFIAWRGLSTWNRQLKGSRDSELSKRILIALYKVEMMLRDIRHPFVEYRLPEGTSQFDQEASNKAWAKIYEEKWKKMSETLAELQAASIEAKAVWDKDFPEVLNSLFECVNELQNHLSDHIQKKINPGYDSLYESRENRKIVYARLGSLESDEFSLRIRSAVSQIDERVRRQITPRRRLLRFWRE